MNSEKVIKKNPLKSNSSELLAPVGNWEMCQAAVHSGAGAIYVGMPFFNARGRTVDLTIDELNQMIDFCHLYGVKVYIAFNILVFENEFKKAIPLLEQIIRLNPDAFIVQDLGLVQLIRKLAPTQRVHASTQMTITNQNAIEFLEDLGIERFVLGREVSISEISLIRENTEKELEVFVHGALCVAYSGQCLTSESIGGRSANRGQCAQACRLEYEMFVDGEKKDLGNKSYLVSPQDLCGIQEIPELMDLGIESFKIEGRLKSPQYVASITQNYTQAIQNHKKLLPYKANFQEMNLVYSRGFFSGWLRGVNHQKLVEGTYSSHRGFEAGQVVSISLAKKQKSIDVTSTVEISAGDGLLFVNLETGREIGGKVYQSEEIKKNNYRLAFANDFSIHELEPKNVIYLNHSSQLSKKLDSTWTDKTKFKQIPLSISVSGKEGDFLTVQVIDDSGHQVTVSSQSNLQTASKAPLSFEALKKNFGALGGTCFQLINLNNELEGDLFLHQKELKEIRRNFSQQLETLRTKKVEIEILSENEVQDWFTNQTTQAKESSNNKDIALNVLIRKKEQLEYLKDLPIHTVYFDFEFGKDYKVALKQARELGVVAGIATTRILKPKEYGHLRYIQKLAPDIILVRNLGALHYFQENEFEVPFVGDYSLNVTNHLTSNYLLSKGLQQLCPSYDLNQEQLEDLVKTTGGENFEVTIHQYIPAFHMEHCVFAGFLSEGTSYKDCGRPCEKYQVELKDTFGQKHPVQADMECRNTMFNGKPQSSAFLIPSLIENGVQAFRFEALTEDKEELRNKILHYHDVITGEKTPEQLFQALGVTEKVGFGEGQLRSTKTYKDRKKKR